MLRSERVRHVSRLVPLCALALACGERPAGEPKGDSTATVSAAPSATDTATSPDQWRLSEEGLGPLRAGQRVEEVRAAVPGTFVVPANSPDDAACAYATWSARPAGVRVMVTDGIVARIDVDSVAIRTEAGAGVGDSEARIDSLYPGRVERRPHKYTDGRYLIVRAVAPRDTIYRFVFETDGSLVTTMRAGRFPEVEWVEGCF